MAGSETIRLIEFTCKTGFAMIATGEDVPVVVPCEELSGWGGNKITTCVEGLFV